jgi:hypothetical protein
MQSWKQSWCLLALTPVQMLARPNRTIHSGPIAVKRFGQLSLPNDVKPFILTLHESLGIDKGATWEEHAKEFDSIDPMLEGTSDFDEPDESLKEM